MINFRVDMEDLAEIISSLGKTKNKSKIVLRDAINNTAKHLRRRLPEAAGDRYNIKRVSRLRKGIDVKKARVGDLVAIVSSRGRPNDLYDFRVAPRAYNPRNRPRLGHRVNVVRGNKEDYLMRRPSSTRDKYRAFVVKFKSGHISVAQRVPGTRMRSNAMKEQIKNIYSPSTPSMLGYELGVYGKLGEETREVLNQEIRKQIIRHLERL